MSFHCLNPFAANAVFLSIFCRDHEDHSIMFAPSHLTEFNLRIQISIWVAQGECKYGQHLLFQGFRQTSQINPLKPNKSFVETTHVHLICCTLVLHTFKFRKQKSAGCINSAVWCMDITLHDIVHYRVGWWTDHGKWTTEWGSACLNAHYNMTCVISDTNLVQ